MPQTSDGSYALEQRRALYKGERALVAPLPKEWIFEIRRGRPRKVDDMDLMGVRRRVLGGERLQDLAAEHQVNQGTIRRIIRSRRKVLENQPIIPDLRHRPCSAEKRAAISRGIRAKTGERPSSETQAKLRRARELMEAGLTKTATAREMGISLQALIQLQRRWEVTTSTSAQSHSS
jgi:hypothetical protein